MNLIKKLSYLGCSLLAVVGTFLPYANLNMDLKNVPAPYQDAFKSAFSLHGSNGLTFYEKIGDLNNTANFKNDFFGIASSLFLTIALMGAFAIFVMMIKALIRKNDKVDGWGITVIGAVSFVFCLISVILGFLFVSIPDTVMNTFIVPINLSVGIGLIIFMVAMALTCAIEPIFKFIVKE